MLLLTVACFAPATAAAESQLTEGQREAMRGIGRVTNFRGSRERGNGTGFLFRDRNNNIRMLTNNHVISGATDLMVTFPDPNQPRNGIRFHADVVGHSPEADLAVLELRTDGHRYAEMLGKEIPTLELGKRSTEYGQRVAAIGFEGTRLATDFGYVRRPGKRYTGTNEIVSHGNSGGPLLDQDGRVIGITSMIEMLQSGRVPSLSVPIDAVRSIVDRIVAGDHLGDGKIQMPRFGFDYAPLSRDKVERLVDNPRLREAEVALPLDPSIQIGSLTKESAAAKAGLQPGDIPVEVTVGGRRIEPTQQGIAAAARTLRPRGEEDVRMRVLRGVSEDSPGRLVDITIPGRSIESRREFADRQLRQAGLELEQVEISDEVRKRIGDDHLVLPEHGVRIKRWAPELGKEQAEALSRMGLPGDSVPKVWQRLAQSDGKPIDARDLLQLDLQEGDVIFQMAAVMGPGMAVETEVPDPETFGDLAQAQLDHLHVLREDRGETDHLKVGPKDPLGMVWFASELQSTQQRIPDLDALKGSD